MNYNVYQINQMIDLLEDFVNGDSEQITVGGIVGTQILKYVMDAVLLRYEFPNILIIDGCQDYVFLAKQKYINYVYYADLFDDVFVDDIKPYNPWLPDIMNPKPILSKSIREEILSKYAFIVIVNAHLIDYRCLNTIQRSTRRMITIVDPFDINGEKYQNVPLVIDSLNKLSIMESLARISYNVETRAIDKKIKCSIKEIDKISKRSIGKIDSNQYITNDDMILSIARDKQYHSNFHKHQKLFVVDDKVNIHVDGIGRRYSLTNKSMCVISKITQSGIQIRMHTSKFIYQPYESFSYEKEQYKIHVVPGNILTVNDSAHHRYNSTVLVLNKDIPLTHRQRYSLLKNTNNITIATI